MILLKEVTGGFTPHGRRTARGMKDLLEQEAGEPAIDCRDIQAIPATFFHELLLTINDVLEEQGRAEAAVRLDNVPYAPNSNHRKIAAHCGRTLEPQETAWTLRRAQGGPK